MASETLALAALAGSMALQLMLSPYTKVEESFSLQAMHDIQFHRTDLAAYGRTTVRLECLSEEGCTKLSFEMKCQAGIDCNDPESVKKLYAYGEWLGDIDALKTVETSTTSDAKLKVSILNTGAYDLTITPPLAGTDKPEWIGVDIYENNRPIAFNNDVSLPSGSQREFGLTFMGAKKPPTGRSEDEVFFPTIGASDCNSSKISASKTSKCRLPQITACRRPARPGARRAIRAPRRPSGPWGGSARAGRTRLTLRGGGRRPARTSTAQAETPAPSGLGRSRRTTSRAEGGRAPKSTAATTTAGDGRSTRPRSSTLTATGAARTATGGPPSTCRIRARSAPSTPPS